MAHDNCGLSIVLLSANLCSLEGSSEHGFPKCGLERYEGKTKISLSLSFNFESTLITAYPDTLSLSVQRGCRGICLGRIHKKQLVTCNRQQAIRGIMSPVHSHQSNKIASFVKISLNEMIIAYRTFCELHELNISFFFGCLVTVYSDALHVRWFIR